ncbi:MAG: FecR family protein, partial [bacterium]
KKNIIYIAILLAGLIGIGSLAANSGPSDTPVALIKKVVQDVTYKTQGMDDWEKAKVGIALNDGEEVKTGFKSFALVLFTDGSGILRVRENSILHIYGEKKEKSMDKNTFIEQGKISFEVSKQDEDEEFKFTTPTVVASIRGTEGLINVTSGTTDFFLHRGSAFLQATMGSQQNGTVGANQIVRIDSTGNVNIIEATQQAMDEFTQSLQIETEKLKIQSDSHEIEIEYFPPE